MWNYNTHCILIKRVIYTEDLVRVAHNVNKDKKLSQRLYTAITQR